MCQRLYLSRNKKLLAIGVNITRSGRQVLVTCRQSFLVYLPIFGMAHFSECCGAQNSYTLATYGNYPLKANDGVNAKKVRPDLLGVRCSHR